ncbi:MAG: S9 family peptidase [Lactobacillus sp.]|jgi:dipeptidyl aminopeptidase/acylaminoacyl peptidase|nr:S9 family peptidase [Lactobacillus sp.]MCI2033351.1 S9 family peptidase [Lactobacillus sp.]
MSIDSSDLFALRVLSRPVVTADGIVIVTNWLDQASNSYHSAISYHAHGTVTALGHDHHHDNAPQLGPDHETLAFLSRDAAGHSQVFTQPLHGGPAVQRTWLTNGVTRFLWHATGDGWWLQTTQPDAAAADWPHAAHLTRLHYRANGHGLRLENVRHELWYQGTAPTNHRRLYTTTADITLAAASGDAQLLLTREAETGHTVHTEAFWFDPQSQTKTPLDVGLPRGQFRVLDLSPDDAHVLLVGNPKTAPDWFTDTLYVYDRQTGQTQELLTDHDLEIGNSVISDTQLNGSGIPAYWADARTIVFTTTYHGASRLFRVTLDGQPELITTEPGTITDFAVGPHGLAYVLSQHTHPSRLFHATDLVVDPNAAWVAAKHPVAPSLFQITREGETIDGFYYPPATATAGHPALLSIHGGPHSAYGNSYMQEFQIETSAGYGVIALNPRGSASYGNHFLTAIYGHYGSTDYQDLMAGVDAALAAHPEINARRLFATGGSYGGFMANWLVTHTDRFAAIISERAIANWVSFFGTSDLGFYYTPREHRAEFAADWSQAATWWRHSPLAYVQNAKTPLLLVHSENDYRVPIEQAEQFYVALKHVGSPVDFLRFPASDHDLSRTGLPNLRVERLESELAWLAQHDLKEN